MQNNQQIKRLYWKCRRGMLEIDIFLISYLGDAYPNASPEEQALFERLLEHPDPDLLLWLTGKEMPDDEAFLPLIARIRECCRNAHRA